MNNYNSIARSKITSMIKSGKCIGVESITTDFIYLNFTGKRCKIDNFGRISWVEFTDKF